MGISQHISFKNLSVVLACSTYHTSNSFASYTGTAAFAAPLKLYPVSRLFKPFEKVFILLSCNWHIFLNFPLPTFFLRNSLSLTKRSI